MQDSTEPERQALRCGFAPPAPPDLAITGVTLKSWKGESPETCPGYLCSLPQVIEGTRARFWRNDLRTFCGGPPTEAILEASIIAEHAANEIDHWRITPVAEGGGREERAK